MDNTASIVISAITDTRIGVATTNGRHYYRFVKMLKQLGLSFDSLLPSEIDRYPGTLVLTSRGEAPEAAGKILLHEDLFENHPAIIMGAIVRELRTGIEPDNLVIGIDPGSLTGISVLYHGLEIENSLYSSVHELTAHIADILAALRADSKLVRIGNGNMGIARDIGRRLNLTFCSSFELEFVDEQHTSPKFRHSNRRGKRDMAAARQITRRRGPKRHVLPLSITG